MRKLLTSVLVLACWVPPVVAQATGSDAIEIPLRVENGRLMVTVEGPEGAAYAFVLGLANTLITESGAARMGRTIGALTLGGVPVVTEHATTVPDATLGSGGSAPAGVLGGETLNKFDALIDVPNGRLVLKPVGRSVRWPGVTLSNPVSLTVLHDFLLRADVAVGGRELFGLLDLSPATLEVNEPLRAATTADGQVLTSFRMGYSGWSDLPVVIADSPTFRAWDRDSHGFVVIGAPIAYECAIAVSWYHSELRTCLR